MAPPARRSASSLDVVAQDALSSAGGWRIADHWLYWASVHNFTQPTKKHACVQ